MLQRQKDELSQELLKRSDAYAGSIALTSELQTSVRSLCRAQGIVDARGALEYTLGQHDVSKDKQLSQYLASPAGLGSRVLACCNGSPKVVSDNGGKPHTPDTLASLLFAVKRRLNKDAHDTRTPEERRGEAVILRQNGLSYADVCVTACFLEVHGFQVEKQFLDRDAE